MKKLALSLLPLLALGACAQGQDAAPVCNMSAIASQRARVAAPSLLPDEASPLMEMPLNSVSITDSSIVQKIYVRQVVAQRNPTGTVKVVAQIVNCTDHPLNIEGRTQFYDATQLPSEPVSGWKRLNLAPRSYVTYAENSTGTANANYYMVEVKETR